MKSIVLTTLSLFLGLFFMLMGTLKVSQMVSRDIHRDIRRSFIQFVKYIPIVKQIGLYVSPRYYRLVWGYLELISGFILVFVPGRLKLFANGSLVFLTIGSIYNHYMAKDKFERIAPCIVFTLMLVCRLVVHYQVRRRERRQAYLKERYLQQAKEMQQNNQFPNETDKTK